jgi:hypothetical protein
MMNLLKKSQELTKDELISKEIKRFSGIYNNLSRKEKANLMK